MRNTEPDVMSYSMSNAKRITELEEFIDAMTLKSPMYHIIDLLKRMNNQLEVLEHEIKIIKENQCQEQ